MLIRESWGKIRDHGDGMGMAWGKNDADRAGIVLGGSGGPQRRILMGRGKAGGSAASCRLVAV